MKALLRSCLAIACCMSLFACASAPKYEFDKAGASDFDRSSAVSDCTYQIRLAKASESEEKQLLTLCMEGKGYRSVEAR